MTASGKIGLGQSRRGAAAFLVVLVTTIMLGSAFVALNTVRGTSLRVMESRDMSRALEVADSCASGAIKALPELLDTMILLMEMEEEASQTGEELDLNANEIYSEQFDLSYFGEQPFEIPEQTPWCRASIVNIQDETPPPGWSEDGGCFKRVTLNVEGQILLVRGEAEADVLASREVNVIGLFGPVQCF